MNISIKVSCILFKFSSWFLRSDDSILLSVDDGFDDHGAKVTMEIPCFEIASEAFEIANSILRASFSYGLLNLLLICSGLLHSAVISSSFSLCKYCGNVQEHFHPLGIMCFFSEPFCSTFDSFRIFQSLSFIDLRREIYLILFCRIKKKQKKTGRPLFDLPFDSDFFVAWGI